MSQTTGTLSGMVLFGWLAATGCSHTQVSDAAAPKPTAGALATANIEGRSGKSLTGNATFQEQGGKLIVKIQVQGADPGDHGVHIHDKGDCSSPDAKSAGGHFNPGNSPHGAPTAAAHHAGDLGNMTIGADGTGTLELTSDVLTVAPGTDSVVGRAIVIHDKADDMTTQPTGASGDRVGCGVIAVAGVIAGTQAAPPATQAPAAAQQ